MLLYIRYYASEAQYTNLTVLLVEYKFTVCLIQPFISQTNTLITYCCPAISYSRMVSPYNKWQAIDICSNTSLEICTCSMVRGTSLNLNCRTCVRRSPVRLFQGKKSLEYCISLDMTHSSLSEIRDLLQEMLL